MKTKTLYVCANCNSDNVEVKAWVKPNRNNEYQGEVKGELGWCCDEEQYTLIEFALLNEDAKVIGFQVVGEDGTAQNGKIHPDMDDSSCVYSLSHAQHMLMKKDDDVENSYWRLLTIWDGDVEEPTMMFDYLFKKPRD